MPYVDIDIDIFDDDDILDAAVDILNSNKWTVDAKKFHKRILSLYHDIILEDPSAPSAGLPPAESIVDSMKRKLLSAVFRDHTLEQLESMFPEHVHAEYST